MTTLGQVLRDLRHRRGLSQEQLAARAQVTARALRYWESDQQQPRDLELRNALQALETTPLEKARALTLLTDNRSIRMIQETQRPLSAATEEMGALPGIGDLLRAMRLRQQWLQERLAQEMGVNRATIMRWEATQTIPSEEHLDRLCSVLHALPQERVVLRAKRLSPAEWKPQLSLEECSHQLRLLSDLRFAHPSQIPLMDLYALSLKRQLRFLLPRYSEALRLLAAVEVQHGWWLNVQDRPTEASFSNRRALDLVEGTFTPEWFWADALNILCIPVARGTGGQKKAIRLMSSYLPLLPVSIQPWVLCDMAFYASQAHDHPLAKNFLTRAEQAYPQGLGKDAKDVPYYRTTRARIHISAGQISEAFNWLPGVAARNERRIFELRLWAEAHLSAGDKSAAAHCLSEAQAQLDLVSLPSLQRKINQLIQIALGCGLFAVFMGVSRVQS